MAQSLPLFAENVQHLVAEEAGEDGGVIGGVLDSEDAADFLERGAGQTFHGLRFGDGPLQLLPALLCLHPAITIIITQIKQLAFFCRRSPN